MQYKTKGSIAVEATIILPITILIVLSIFMVVRVIYIRNNVEYALNQATKQLSAYSSVYNAVYDGLDFEMSDNEKFSRLLVSAGVLDSGKKATFDVKQALVDIEANKNNKNYLINFLETSLNADMNSNNLEDELSRMAAVILKNRIEGLKGEAGKTLVKYFFAKAVDARIFDTESVGGCVYRENEGLDVDLIDFSESKIFVDDNEIELVAKYKIALHLPINIVGNINMRQRSAIRSWFVGENEGVDRGFARFSVWNLTALKRGQIITDNEQKREALRTDILLEVRSLDVRAPSYKTQSSILSTVKSNMTDFAAVASLGKTKIFRLIIPTGTMNYLLPDTLTKLKNDGISKGMTFEIFDRY